MVHLNRVSTNAEIEEVKKVFEDLKLGPVGEEEEQDDFTATVYGSKWAAEDLPKYEMPEKEMPAQV